jgi:hypothetical protein
MISSVISLKSKTHFSRSIALAHLSDSGAPPEIYHGPTSQFDDMLSRCELEDLGLTMMVGPSKAGRGMGLYLAVDDNIGTVSLPFGTLLTRYSQGTFTKTGDGDKTVGILLDSLQTGVFYKNKLTPLKSLVEICGTERLPHIIKGLEILLDDKTDIVHIQLDACFENRVFVPNIDLSMRPGNIGIYANDLGFHQSTQYRM